MNRNITFFRNYFINFYSQQNEKKQEKIEFVLELIRTIEKVPSKFLKYLENTDAIYEIRVRVGNDQIRIFCFFDDKNFVILVNSFYKKTQKTPRKEIALAEKLKKEYFEQKYKGKKP